MPSPESPNQAIAPEGAIFLSEGQLPDMLMDFTVQRAVGIMSQGGNRTGYVENIGSIVERVIQAAMQDPPQEVMQGDNGDQPDIPSVSV